MCILSSSWASPVNDLPYDYLKQFCEGCAYGTVNSLLLANIKGGEYIITHILHITSGVKRVSCEYNMP